jgi:hypothetical protein
MAATVQEADYVIGQSAADPTQFTVSKFEGGEQPTATYKVIYRPKTGFGRCDCPAATFRFTGSKDKHVLLVKRWLADQ